MRSDIACGIFSMNFRMSSAVNWLNSNSEKGQGDAYLIAANHARGDSAWAVSGAFFHWDNQQQCRPRGGEVVLSCDGTESLSTTCTRLDREAGLFLGLVRKGQSRSFSVHGLACLGAGQADYVTERAFCNNIKDREVLAVSRASTFVRQRRG